MTKVAKQYLIKKHLILFFVIAIPLLAGFLVGRYGYNADKFGQGAWKNEFRNEYMEFTNRGTTEEQIDQYVQFGLNNQYYLYNPTPIFENVMTNNDGDNLFKIRIYQSFYTYTENNEKVARIQYLYFIYDVQYLQIREEFSGDAALKQEIRKASIPRIRINLTEIKDDQPGDKNFVPISTSRVILDKGADVDYVDGTKVPEGGSYEGTAQNVFIVSGFNPLTDPSWSNTTKIEIVAFVSGVVDDNNNEIETTIADFTLTNYDANPNNIDTESFVEAYQQDLDRLGYFRWIFWKRLWWISLIGIASIGFITSSFYIVWLAEEKKAMEARLKSNKRVKK